MKDRVLDALDRALSDARYADWSGYALGWSNALTLFIGYQYGEEICRFVKRLFV